MNNNNEYLSDDEDINNDEMDKEKLFDELYPMNYDEDDEEYDEIRNIINNKSESSIIYNIYDENKDLLNIDNIKKISSNQLNKMNLKSFNTYIQQKEEDEKPKKFMSKRCINKKLNEEKIHVVKKRSFNPRLTPYFKSDYYKNIILKKNTFSDNNFPSL